MYLGYAYMDNNGIKRKSLTQEFITIKDDSLIIIRFNAGQPVPVWLSSLEQAHSHNNAIVEHYRIERSADGLVFDFERFGVEGHLHIKKDGLEMEFSHWTFFYKTLDIDTRLSDTLELDSVLINRKFDLYTGLSKDISQQITFGEDGNFLEDSTNGLYSLTNCEGLIFLTQTTCATCAILSGFSPPVILYDISENELKGIRFNSEFEPVFLTFVFTEG